MAESHEVNQLVKITTYYCMVFIMVTNNKQAVNPRTQRDKDREEKQRGVSSFQKVTISFNIKHL